MFNFVGPTNYIMSNFDFMFQLGRMLRVELEQKESVSWLVENRKQLNQCQVHPCKEGLSEAVSLPNRRDTIGVHESS